MRPVIRPAALDDVPALSQLAKQTWADAFGGPLSAEDLEAELEASRSETYFISAIDETTILVAEEGGVLVGYVQFGDVQLREIDVRAGDRSLHRLYVRSTAQGRGLGRTLLKAALAHPRLASSSRVFLTVWEENTAALALYESFGFKSIGTTSVTIAGKEVGEDLVMVLDQAGRH